jgi:RHS repeat-associated protein
VRQRLDGSGEIDGELSYRPFGTPLEGDGGDPYGFTGEAWDAEAGLLYLRARFYDPQSARFFSPDTIIPDFSYPPSLHRYTYVNNNAVNFTDPSGHRRCGPDDPLWDETCDDVIEYCRYFPSDQNCRTLYPDTYVPIWNTRQPGPAEYDAYCSIVGCGEFGTPELVIGTLEPVIRLDLAIIEWVIDSVPPWLRRQWFGVPPWTNIVLEALSKSTTDLGWRVDVSAVTGPGGDVNTELICSFDSCDCEVVSTVSVQFSPIIGAGGTTGLVVGLPYRASSTIPAHVFGIDVPLPPPLPGIVIEADLTLESDVAMLYFGVGPGVENSVYTAVPVKSELLWNARPIDLLFRLMFGTD